MGLLVKNNLGGGGQGTHSIFNTLSVGFGWPNFGGRWRWPLLCDGLASALLRPKPSPFGLFSANPWPVGLGLPLAWVRARAKGLNLCPFPCLDPFGRMGCGVALHDQRSAGRSGKHLFKPLAKDRCDGCDDVSQFLVLRLCVDGSPLPSGKEVCLELSAFCGCHSFEPWPSAWG